uniref:Aminotransferase-like plant mobile domain-containing protein n=1 Tax=Hordeum vulgare subsp. vulgare TaxID=112509 RepID=A0A8I6Y446_HORVV
MCLRDQHLWRVRCPMICFYAVEWHLPHRVSKQFGVQQCIPPDYVETSVKLHKTNRQNNKTVINWEEHHMGWVDMWNAQRQHRVENDQTPDTDKAAYLRHLEWMRTEYRVIHKAVWTRSDCLDLLPSETADVAFNNSIREKVGAHLDYGPLHDRVVRSSFKI